MKSKNDQSRKQPTSADELICDYLNDILGNDQSIIVSEKNSETQSISSFLTEQKSSSAGLEYATELTEKDVNSEDSIFVEPLVRPEQGFYGIQKRDRSLITTIKLHQSIEPQRLHTQEESLIILLTNLYFLRRPLPPKVRQCFLDLSEQAIDDFHASKWIKQTDIQGVLSEA